VGAGGTYTASVTLNAAAAAGNNLSRVRIFYGSNWISWPVFGTTFGPSNWNWDSLAPGEYSLYADALDSNGNLTETPRVRFVVNSASANPPTISIATPASGSSVNAPGSFNLTASVTPGGAAVNSVTYYQGSTTLGASFAAPYSVTWSGVAPGTYEILALAVDANNGRRFSAPISVTVVPTQPPAVSIISPASGSTFETPPNLTITADAVPASGANITKVEFFDGSTLLGTDTSFPYQYMWDIPPGGTHSLTAKATDDRGASATSSAVTITITTPTPPTVSIVSPASGSSFEAPTSVPVGVQANAASPATIARIELYANDKLVGLGSTPLWGALQPGSYTVKAKAIDNRGASAFSAPITVIITGAPGGGSGETVTFLHTDTLGSPIAATDVEGAVLWKEQYRPYGDRVTRAAPSTNNRLFYTGKANDAETSLTYFGARYYDPVVGRFMAIDAVEFSESNVHSFNRYAYGNNGPYRFVDPDGNSPVSLVLMEVAKQTGIGYALGVAADSISQYAAFGTVDLGMAATSNAAMAGGKAGLVSGFIGGAAKAYSAGKASEQTFEIIDGVRTAKAADLTGNSAIPAQVLNAEGKTVGTQNIPVDRLLSPKSSIDVSTGGKMDRFMNTLNQTKAGSTPPPITVQAGKNGTRISDVTLDAVGH
jgi:RHS repeat-associated protein